jgi:thiol:disulfide interchange protein
MNAMRKSLMAMAAVVALAGSFAVAQNRTLYSDTADAHADIAAAVRTAAREHKRVILDFGGNWCGDCIVLDIYFHQGPNLELLEKNFVLVHVNIGHYDRNTDVAEKYAIPLKNGVPLLVVLNARGQVLFVQRHQEFEKMRMVTPESVTEFLNQWKPKR